ncbi:hemE [Wigglesworthia glossinidia endosymbiont of Glossina brevipalpis]|uniref:Uroporphyrinogen decarboxylase n=1 Tax=Wigglesworthia glossinidia brevipalpis TaxID=36870 RepID=DCUP_WIGBR|nr:RecName: Full=Uroporphyrinogen decarboxylase; Short=UPD; Short=URO-D [Wigglesworthia glossinidia endosymbiont of Glossina brevipalpis]BAC24654.1 hemE [Wigglesworthia glossinidia endosymbiont of Glossina brevipalpis]
MQFFENDSYLRSALRKSVKRTPIWIMRQSGRYLKEYQSIKKQAKDFLSLCKTPDLSSKAALIPIKKFSLDAAIIFSDILILPYAMGMDVNFYENLGPSFLNPISSISDMKNLNVPDPEKNLKYVLDSIKIICKELDKKIPLIGFSGSPWTLACYMIEGKCNKIFSKIKKMIYQNSKELHFLLKKITNSIILYLNSQIIYGVNAIIIFDTWGGILTEEKYCEYSLHYMSLIIKNLFCKYKGNKIPVTIFTKNGGQWIKKIAKSGCDVIALDWSVDIEYARKQVNGKIAIQGNMDPFELYGSFSSIEEETNKILSKFGYNSGHIFSLGHGIYKDTPPENVNFLIESVHNLSKKYHKKNRFKK